MVKLKYILSVFIFFNSVLLLAQTKVTEEEAAYYYEIKDYKKAYELYDVLYSKKPSSLEYKFHLAYSSLFYPEKKARAIELFQDLKKFDKSPDIDYYLAKAYHINYRFDEAIKNYNIFLMKASAKKNDEYIELVENSSLGIVNCENGKSLLAKNVIIDINNIGSPINTDETEFVPVISSDESVMIFTYVGKNSTGGLLDDELKKNKEDGKYHEDIFISTRSTDSTWTIPKGITSLNTNGNDAAVALSSDGQTLFTFVSDSKNLGDLYFSTLSGTEWSTPEKLNSNINSEFWEGSCSITADGRYLYFASERPGGSGGRDLYVSEKVDGDWGLAVNLGPMINTKYNEDAPFIHPDGITMFFSSEGHKSIGGYDIMYSIKKENNWIEPVSMGIPLNTTEDDKYYVINAKGDVGYFSSNRSGSGGKGGHDIYTVTPGIFGEKPVLALLKGKVFLNNVPGNAKIDIIKKENNEAIGPYFSNSKTGNYLMALSPGSGYLIKISAPDMEIIEEEIDIEKLQRFVEIKKDFYLYAADFYPKSPQISIKSMLDSLLNSLTSAESFNNDAIINNLIPTETVVATETISSVVDNKNKKEIPISTIENLTPCGSSPIPDFAAIKGKSLNDPKIYKQLLQIGGTMCSEGLVFKVQIAAYKHPENYKFDHLKQFGAPEIVNYPDSITRFTQFNVATIKEAESARQKIIAKGQKDAWITGFIGGKRYTLEELILENFFGKAVN